MFLPGHKLDQFIAPCEETHTKQASYDLRLGQEAYIVGDAAPRILTRKDPFLTIAPGQFAILTTKEKVCLDKDHIAFITVRNTFKMQGLVNISGFHVDPTYKGILKFAVNNVGPSDIRLKYDGATFTIFVAQVAVPGDKVRPEGQDGVSLQDIQLLGGSSITLGKIRGDIERLQLMVLVYAPFALGAFVALLLLIWKSLM